MPAPDDLSPSVTSELISYLAQFVTEQRFRNFREVAALRTRHITVALEDIFQPHNASAVLRTCDCFGIQDVHIIENRNTYKVNPDVALGSSKWLDLFKYRGHEENTTVCLESLRSQGYRIVATTPHRDGYTPDTLPLDRKIALVFGTELEGLTETALGMADDYLMIPMVGFTESLNISVSAAIFVQSLTHRLRNSDISWRLTEIQQNHILLAWLKQSVNKSEMIVDGYLRAQREKYHDQS